MSGDNKLLLEFAARVDSSITAAFSSLQKSIDALESTTRKLVGSNKAMASANAMTRKGFTDNAAAANSAAAAMDRVGKATDSAAAKSAEYYRKLNEITKSSTTTVAQQQSQLRALENTEKAYQKARGAISGYSAQIKVLQEQNARLNGALASNPTDRALAGQLTTNQGRLQALQQAEKILAQNMASGFGFTKRYGDELSKIMRMSKDFVNESTTFRKAAQQIGSLYTNKGSLDYKDHIRALSDYQKEQKQKLSMVESQIKNTTSTMRGAVGEERTLLDKQLRNLREQRKSIQSLTAQDYVAGAKQTFLSGSSLMKEIQKVSQLGPAAAKNVEAIASQYTGGQLTKNAAIQQVRDIGKAHLAAVREENRKVAQETRKTQAQALPTTGGLTGMANQIVGTVQTLASYAVAGTVIYGIAAAFKEAASSVVLYDQALKDLQAITQGTTSEIAALGNKVLEVADRSKFGVELVAESAKVIGQAGFTAAETMVVVDNAMNLAHGTMSKIETTSDLMTTVIRAFRLEAGQAAEVADILAVAVNKSKLDIEKLRVVFNYVGPVAMDTGVSLREVAAATMVLANQGMRASTIGTSLRNIFSRLKSPSEGLAKAMRDAGKDVASFGDATVPLTTKLKDLQEVLKPGIDLYKLFGLRAAGAMAVLRDSPQLISKMVNELYRMGLAQEMAATQTEGLQNKLLNLQNKLSVLFIKAGQDAGQGLGLVVDMLRAVIEAITPLAEGGVGRAIVALGSFATAFGVVVVIGKVFAILFGATVVGALASFGSGIYTAIAALISFSTATATATTLTTRLAAAMGLLARHPVMLAMAALITLVLGVGAAFEVSADKAQKTASRMSASIAKQIEDIERLKRAREATAIPELAPEIKQQNQNLVISKHPELAAALIQAQTDEEKLAVYDAAIYARREKAWSSQIDQWVFFNKQKEDAYNASNDINAKIAKLAKDTAERPFLDSMDEASLTAHHMQAKGMEKLQKEAAKLNSAASQSRESLMGVAEALRAMAEDAVALSGDKSVEAQDKILLDFLTKRLGDNQQLISTITKMVTEARTNRTKQLEQTLVQERESLGAVIQSITSSEDSGLYNILMGDTETAMKAFSGLFATASDDISTTKKDMQMFTAYLPQFQADLAKATKDYNDKIEKIQKDYASSPEAVQDALRLRATEEFHSAMLTSLRKMYDERALIQDIAFQKEETALLEQFNKGLINEKEFEDARSALQVEKAKEAVDTAVEELEILVANYAAASNLPDLTKHMDIIVEGDLSALPEVLREAILRGGFAPILLAGAKGIATARHAEATAQSAYNRQQSRRAGGGRGREERSEIEAIKYRNEREKLQEEYNYARGLTSYSEYVNKKIAIDKAMYDAREVYVAKLEKTSPAQGRKERESLELDRMKFEMETFKELRDTEIKILEAGQKAKEQIYANEALMIDKNYTHFADVAKKEHELNQLKIQDRVDFLELQLEKYDWSEVEREQKVNELATARNELLQEENAYRDKLLEQQDKFLEMDIKRGTAGRAQKEDFLLREVAQGNISSTEALNQWSTEYGGFFDRIATGFRMASDSAKTFGETVVDMSESVYGHLMDASDAFVETWHHGTKDVRQVFNDFLEAMALDFEKAIFRSFTTTILMGESGEGGILGSLLSLVGGGPANNMGQINPYARNTASVQGGQGQGATASGIASLLTGLFDPLKSDVAEMSDATFYGMDYMGNAVDNGMGAMTNYTQMFANNGVSIFQQMGSGIMNFFSGLGNSIMSIIGQLGGGGDAGGFFGTLLNSLFGSSTPSAASSSWASGVGGSLSTDLTNFGFSHAGSIVGEKSLYRKMSSTLLQHAPRLHSGLAPDEYPAILQRGEEVRSRAAVARDKNSGDDGLQVVINNYGDKKVTAQKGVTNQGERELLIQIGDNMAGQIQTPGTSLNKAVKSITGTKTSPVVR